MILEDHRTGEVVSFRHIATEQQPSWVTLGWSCYPDPGHHIDRAWLADSLRQAIVRYCEGAGHAATSWPQQYIDASFDRSVPVADLDRFAGALGMDWAHTGVEAVYHPDVDGRHIDRLIARYEDEQAYSRRLMSAGSLRGFAAGTFPMRTAFDLSREIRRLVEGDADDDDDLVEWSDDERAMFRFLVKTLRLLQRVRGPEMISDFGSTDVSFAMPELPPDRGRLDILFRIPDRHVLFELDNRIDIDPPPMPVREELVRRMSRQVNQMLLFGSSRQPPVGLMDYRAYGPVVKFTGSAERKAVELLVRHLTPGQAESYKRNKSFVVVGSSTGREYEIRHGRQINVHRDDWWRFCLLTPDCPIGDQLLAQKMMIQYVEDDFLQEAIRWEPLRRRSS